MKNRILLSLLPCLLMLLVAGCTTDNNNYQGMYPPSGQSPGGLPGDGGSGDQTVGPEESEVPAAPGIEDDDADDLVENSTFENTVTIVYSGNSATVTNSTEGVSAAVSGAGVTVTSTAKGVAYAVSGNTTNGFLKIYSDSKFKLTLNGVSITNPSGPAVNIQSGKRCFVVLGDGSVNSLADGSSYSAAPNDEDQKGCMFSEGELIFSGSGKLTVTGKNKHGIASDDYVRIRNGEVVVAGAASDGVHTNDAFIMDGGSLSVTSGSDGIEVGEGHLYIKGGTVTVNAGDDGLVASYEEGDATINPSVVITGGSVTVNTSAQKGHALKATGDIAISGGNHTIKTTGAAAKGINADGNVVIGGGTTTITTFGDAIYEDGDTSSAAGIKTGDNTGGHFGMTAGTLTVKSSGKGGKGVNTSGSFILEGGVLSVTTTGSTYKYSNSITSSPKGIKASGSVTIHDGNCTVAATHEGIESTSLITVNGGTVEVTSTDDAINVSNRGGAIVINGGKVYAYASGNDGIDSNGTITITGGLVVSSGTSSPEEGFDCDQNAFQITGGTVIGTGGATSYPTLATGQHAIVYGGSGSAGEYIQLKNASGESLIIYKLPRTLSSMTMLLSHPDVARSSSYTLVKGGTVSGGTEDFHGYYTGATYSGGTTTSVSTGTSAYTTVGNVSGGPGGGPGGRPW